MNVWPLRFRDISVDQLIFANDAGDFFAADHKFLDRYATDTLTRSDQQFLLESGHAFKSDQDLAFTAFAYRWTQRQAQARALSYVILIPTLRCNLSCSYCQVARVDEATAGYDWHDNTFTAVLNYLDNLTTDHIKIEFQGGEPLLRLDLLDKVRDHCRRRFKEVTFVVCTNLQRLSDAHWRFFEDGDTKISTSLDGKTSTHQQHRTKTDETTAEFFANLEYAVRQFGAEKVSALPTIDIGDPPPPKELVDSFAKFGLRSIYLRPINYHGFARKRWSADRQHEWNEYHSDFIDYLVDINAKSGQPYFEEYYFTHCLRRIFRAGLDGHVDLRNPNLVAADYIVIDHDGSLYPTDEARMLSRVKTVDLSIGQVETGIDSDRVALLNSNSLNNFDPDCIHCPYQPYCGTDTVDDLSRYGRIDLPRHQTWFCARQMALFDKAFTLLCSQDKKIRHSVALWLGINEYTPTLVPHLP